MMTHWLLGDHLGSTAITATSNGTKTGEVRYKPWGEDRYTLGTTPTSYRYTGQRSEMTGIGLYFYGARWYDPMLGRFTSADTIIPEQSQGVQAWDRYAYVNNSPINFIDPSGHGCEDLHSGAREACIEARDQQEQSETGDSTTPFQVGLEWLTGLGDRKHNFEDGDTFTELLQQHDHIQDVRNLIIKRLSEGDFTSYEESYDLSGLQGVYKYFKDYSTLLTGGLTGNLAVTYLGSYYLRYFVTNVDQTKKIAEVQFYVSNESNLASLLHPPLLGYTKFWKRNISPFINNLVPDGPMSEVTQYFLWTETIAFP